jgi:hypothetical protein
MRGGSANNIYVIPTPDKLTFGTGMLLAAACCVPAILSLVSMWNKILQDNWKVRFGGGNEDEQITGTNGATVGKMEGVNTRIRLLLSVVEVPVFGGAVLVILFFGELNFFSKQVRYQVSYSYMPLDSPVGSKRSVKNPPFCTQGTSLHVFCIWF